MSDIVEKLRACHVVGLDPRGHCDEAASEITRLRAMLRIVREHLAKNPNSDRSRSALVVATDEMLRGKT